MVEPDLVDDPSRSAAREPIAAAVTAERRKRWARHATFAAASLGAVGSFLAIERTIPRSNGNAFDRAVLHAIGRRRSPLRTAIVRGVTSLGGVPGVVSVSLFAIWRLRRAPRAAVQVALGALGGIFAELGIKRLFRRTRPSMFEHLEQVSSSSFPSGHSMASSSLYLTLALVGSRGHRLRSHRGAIIGAATTLAGMIGATRVYLGVHWPTDVLGGLALGTAWACAAEAGFDWAGARAVAAAPATT